MSVMALALEDLPSNTGALKHMVVLLSEENDLLRAALRLQRARQFGHQSERVIWGDGTEQLLLFASLDLSTSPSLPAEDRPKEPLPRKKPKKKPGRKRLSDHLPRKTEEIDVPEKDKICSRCGKARCRIGEDVSERLDVIPAHAQVLRQVRPKYGPCNCCDELVDAGEPTAPPAQVPPPVLIAPVPEQLIPKGIATPGLLAFIIAAKFADGTPFYRLEKQFRRMGVEVGRGSMAAWTIKVAQACARLMALLHREILAGPVVGVDETTIQVLKEPGRKATTKSYLWLFRGGLPGREALFYLYSQTRAGTAAKQFLSGYRGGVQTDGYTGYDWCDELLEIVHLGCLAHVRRYFMDVLKATAKPLHLLRETIAGEALERIRALYRIEQEARQAGLTGERLREVREREAKPLLDSLLAWLQEKKQVVPPRTLLGKAIAYALGQWPKIIRYVEDGAYPIDNNLTENGIRPAVMGRKNWLFADTPAGAHANAVMYSLVETARANGLEPYWYLRCLFERLPLAATEDDFRALIPQNFDRELIAKAMKEAGI